MILSVDSDVLVLAVYCASLAKEVELWVAFGIGNKKRYIPAHKIASKMGDERSIALPMFHVTAFHRLLVKARKRHFKYGQQLLKLPQSLFAT